MSSVKVRNSKILNWLPESWQTMPNSQTVSYPATSAIDKVIQQLAAFPPLVSVLEINQLQQQLREAALGRQFLLQGGDCAESFEDCQAKIINKKIKILLQMGLILRHGLAKPIIHVGRIAGQYAKPRSSDIETINGLSLPSYRGDLINKSAFTQKDRTPEPQLLLQGYQCAALTLQHIRAAADNGFAGLQYQDHFNVEFLKHSPFAAEYQSILNAISHARTAYHTECKVKHNFFTSHEALHLIYEQALTRYEVTDGKFYNLSTHFPWTGMRTTYLNSAHIEYLRGIANPIAIKIGPLMTNDILIELIELLNPHNEPGRLTLIHRFGANAICDLLPPLIAAAKTTRKSVLWSCDPMHGNTEIMNNGMKTRKFDDILRELEFAFKIHRQMNNFLGGVHFELTGEDVTECLGGASGLTINDLNRAYKSLVDPRLNYEQALEMAMSIVRSY